MSFSPPFCPHRQCRDNLAPRPGFARRHGHYLSVTRGRPVARFRCRGCRRTFSYSTYRYAYR